LFLAVWLAAFTVQTTDALTWLARDTCTEETRGSAADPCDDGCPRCVCCARVPVFIPAVVPVAVAVNGTETAAFPPIEPSSTPSPHRIYHVPKRALT
jgi:hypothetical protein